MAKQYQSSRRTVRGSEQTSVSIGHAQRLRGMCNHGLISEELAQEVIEKIQSGDQSIDGAIDEFQESCNCGLLLPSRARRILNSVCCCGD